MGTPHPTMHQRMRKELAAADSYADCDTLSEAWNNLADRFMSTVKLRKYIHGLWQYFADQHFIEVVIAHSDPDLPYPFLCKAGSVEEVKRTLVPGKDACLQFLEASLQCPCLGIGKHLRADAQPPVGLFKMESEMEDVGCRFPSTGVRLERRQTTYNIVFGDSDYKQVLAPVQTADILFLRLAILAIMLHEDITALKSCRTHGINDCAGIINFSWPESDLLPVPCLKDLYLFHTMPFFIIYLQKEGDNSECEEIRVALLLFWLDTAYIYCVDRTTTL